MVTVGRRDGELGLRVGRIGWVGQADLSVEVPGRMIGAEMHDELLVALYDDVALVLSPDGSVRSRLVAPPSLRFRTIACLPPLGGRPAATVVMAHPQDGSLLAHFSVLPAPCDWPPDSPMTAVNP